MRSYDRLERDEATPKKVVDHSRIWEKLEPVADANSNAGDLLARFCTSKRITVDALRALGARVVYRKSGAVELAFAGFDNSFRVVAIKYRPLSGSSHESYTEAPSTWLRPIIVGNRGSLDWLVAEGETDGARLYGLLGDSCAILVLPAGAKTFKREWVDLIPRGARVGLCYDADHDGDVGAEKAAKLLGNTFRIRPPLEGDDWCDWDGDRAELLELVKTAATASRGARLVKIGEVDPRRVDWFEEELIPRSMVTGLVAAGGTVKGLYGIHLAVKAAKRGERSLFVCSEDALEYIVRPRFMAAGSDAMLAYSLDYVEADGTHRNLRFPSDTGILRTAMGELEPVLVVIDPVASHLEAGVDMGANNQMREVLQPLISLAVDFGAAILPVYHLGKDRTRGAIGSVAFEDACRCVITAARDDEDEDVRHVELTKSNICPIGYGRKLRIVEVPLEIGGETVGVAKLVDEGRSSKSVPQLLNRRQPPGPDPIQRETARGRLVEILSDHPGGSVNAGETKKKIADELKVSESTVWRAFDQLKKEELVGAEPVKDDFGSVLEWRWYAKAALFLGARTASVEVPGPVRRNRVTARDRLLAALSPEFVAALEELVDERMRGLEGIAGAGDSKSEWLTVIEAAELLRCKRQRVDDLLSQGRFARYKDGSRTLISRAEVEEYLKRHSR